MLQWPVPELSGTVVPQVSRVSAVDDITVEEFSDIIRDKITKDSDAVV
jgi:hypothetical protein